MRYAQATLLAGMLATSFSLAGPNKPHRLQVHLKAETASAALVATLKQRAMSYASFRGLGPASVRLDKANGHTIQVEFPLREGEDANTEALQKELTVLLTRPGGLELTWDKGTIAMDALRQLQQHIGAGEIDSKIQYAELERALATAKPQAGVRWVIETTTATGRKRGPLYNIYAAGADSFLTDSAIASVKHSDAMVGPQGIMLTLTSKGANTLERETAGHVGQRLLLLFEGRVNTAPTVRQAIRGGRVQYSLAYMFSRGPEYGEVEQLVAVMRGGRLETAVLIVKVKVVRGDAP